MTNILKSTLVILILITAQLASAQLRPRPNYTGANCSQSVLSFFANAPGYDTYKWDFGGPAGPRFERDPKHSYKSAGTYKVTFTAKDKSGVLADFDTSFIVNILQSPTAKISLLSDTIQCFEDNLFCIADSSFSVIGSKIIKASCIFSDGALLEEVNPKFPRKICHNIGDGREGKYYMKLVLEDKNGCVSNVVFRDLIEVKKAIGLNISLDKKISNDTTSITITNNTYLNWLKDSTKSVSLDELEYFKVDFGDGNIIIGDKDNNTEYWYGKNKTGKYSYKYYSKGNYNIVYSVKRKDGCEATSQQDFSIAHEISGSIYFDKNQNNIKDADEKGIRALIKAGKRYAYSDTNGNYKILVNDSTKTNLAVVTNNKIFNLSLLKPYDVFITKNNRAPTKGYDFAYPGEKCNKYGLTIGAFRHRPCMKSRIQINILDPSLKINDSQKLYLDIPPQITILKADHKYTKSGNTYAFTLNSSNQTHKTIKIVDSVLCDTRLVNSSICLKASIIDQNSCSKDLPSNWDSSYLSSSIQFLNDSSVNYIIKNLGKNMRTGSYFVLESDDGILVKDTFRLEEADSIIINSASKKVKLFRTKQVIRYPKEAFNDIHVFAFDSFTLNKTSIDDYYGGTLLKNSTAYTERCILITGSYDPNDKAVYPPGKTLHTKEGIYNNCIPSNSRLKYKIRFQNTGNDTAFTVRILDQLDKNLDISSFNVLSASHDYKIEFGDAQDRTILNVIFDNILLPDSHVNLLGSQGYIEFEIDPILNVPQKTEIFNKVGIYFDFNEPIYTNTVKNTIYDGENRALPISYSIDGDKRLAVKDIHTEFCGYYESPSKKYQWTEAGNYRDTINVNMQYDSILFINLKEVFVNASILKSSDSLIAQEINTKTKFQWLDCIDDFQKIASKNKYYFIPEYNSSFALESQLYNCIDTSECIEMKPVGVSELDLVTATVEIYPNPSDGTIYIQGEDLKGPLQIRIFDLNGQLVYQELYRNSQEIHQLNLKSLEGLYIVQVNDEQTILRKKVVINR